MIKTVFGTLHSKLMQREIPYRVILPTNYDQAQKSFPVIYLLHGLFGSCDNWLDLTKITDYSAEKELILVLVEGGNGWYTDSVCTTGNKFESYIIKELVTEIENLFKIIAKRESRAIVGLSMGGYGAFKFSLKNPDLFSFAGSMSGAFVAPQKADYVSAVDWEILNPSILETFGKENNQTRLENDLFLILDKLSAERISKLPYFYFDCGLEDSFININREFAKALKKKNISFEFHEIKGGHNWDYWDKQIRKILLIIENKLNKEK